MINCIYRHGRNTIDVFNVKLSFVGHYRIMQERSKAINICFDLTMQAKGYLQTVACQLQVKYAASR